MDLSKNPIIFLFKRIWKYSEGNRRMLSLSVILASIAHTLTFAGTLKDLLNTSKKFKKLYNRYMPKKN
ncbi:MAG: hypothetical protein GOV02_01850 [Candidatus Aenigmarchaeota archaeon]|nr:hypothetical protein [Candidatus Aenigmarchaeota archaeon]